MMGRCNQKSSLFENMAQEAMEKIQPVMSEQRTMVEAYQASRALQKTFEDDYQSLIDFTAECIQVVS